MGRRPSYARGVWQVLDRMSTRGGNLTYVRCKVTISIYAHTSNTIPTPPGSEGMGDQTSDVALFEPSYGWPQLGHSARSDRAKVANTPYVTM
jgi:hypothetical protein